MEPIPLCDLERRYREHQAEYDTAVRQFLETQRFTLGSQGEAFEREFAAFLGAPHAVGVANGTDAIELALRALGIGPGDEVVTVAHTFIATVSAIRFAGATPVLVDVDPRTHTMDPDALRDAVTARTKAVVPVHLYGRPADMPPILEVARDHDLRVVEDAAQAHGARLGGKIVGTWGDAACFSFYPTKNLGAMGDAGAVVARDASLAETVRVLRHHGQRRRNHQEALGRNSRLDEVQAAVLRVGLRHLEVNNRRRRDHARRYCDLLRGTVGVPEEGPNENHVYHLFVIETARRDEVQAVLETHGIGTGVHYPIPAHLQPSWPGPSQKLPDSERLASTILSIPMFPELEPFEVEHVARALRAATGP